MKIKITLTLAFLCVAFFAFSQIEIKGKIVAFPDLLPVESASIYLKNTTIGTVSNTDGRFVLLVANEFLKDTLVVSSIGYKSYKIQLDKYDSTQDVFLDEDIAALDEVLIVAETRPKTGNEIVLKAISKLSENLPDSAYLQKGFLRHKERNRLEFKWLIESAFTLYDSGYSAKSSEHLKINIDQVRKSYDLRDVDSIFSYVAYKNRNLTQNKLKVNEVRRSALSQSQLVEAIKWNDTRVNGLQNIFQGQLNLFRNAQETKALFGEDILQNHQFALDTIVVDDGRKLYKIKISEGSDYVDLDTKGIYNDGYQAQGWLYIYYDNYAIKKVEYELVAASDKQKSRSKSLFGTTVNHKLMITYIDYLGKMYPNYIYYETPKLVNVGFKTNQKVTKEDIANYNKNERYYYTIQEILFSEIILDKDLVNQARQGPWDMDIFSAKPYNKEFWKTYNLLLENEEDEKLIDDLSKRATFYKD